MTPAAASPCGVAPRRGWLALAVFAGIAAVLTACGGAPRPAPAAGRPGATSPRYVERGLATFYGVEEHGGPTASGERFDRFKLTAAHRTLRFGTRVRVTNTHNGRSVEVRINDRGPYAGPRRIIDLSEAAARRIGMIEAGVVPVIVEVLP